MFDLRTHGPDLRSQILTLICLHTHGGSSLCHNGRISVWKGVIFTCWLTRVWTLQFCDKSGANASGYIAKKCGYCQLMILIAVSVNVNVNDCLSPYVSPVIAWWPVQGVPYLRPPWDGISSSPSSTLTGISSYEWWIIDAVLIICIMHRNL